MKKQLLLTFLTSNDLSDMSQRNIIIHIKFQRIWIMNKDSWLLKMYLVNIISILILELSSRIELLYAKLHRNVEIKGEYSVLNVFQGE